MKCAMKFCPNSAVHLKKKDGVTFHIFPVEHSRRIEWIKAVNRNNWLPSKASVICSCHFSKDCFYTTEKGFQRLFKSAVPSPCVPMPGLKKIKTEQYPRHDSSPEGKLRNEVRKWKKLFEERTRKVKTLQKSKRFFEIKITELKIRKSTLTNSLMHQSELDICTNNLSSPEEVCNKGVHSIVYVTVPSTEIGQALGKKLIERKLAACVNVVPEIISIYEWENEINEDNEALLTIKTQTSRVDELIRFVDEHHPYEVCHIISVPINDGNLPYLKWISNTVPEIK